jgi:hypothetical protein
MISEFNIENDLCHNDTTSASVYGECSNNKTANSRKALEVACYSCGFAQSDRHNFTQI